MTAKLDKARREVLELVHTALDTATMAPGMTPQDINELTKMMGIIRFLIRRGAQ